MNPTIELLNRVRSKTETGSDYAVAQLIGISRSRMSRYIRELDVMHDEDVIARAAILAGWNPLETVARFRRESAKTEASRRIWEKFAALARSAAIFAAIFVCGFSPRGEAFSEGKTAGAQSLESIKHSIQCAYIITV